MITINHLVLAVPAAAYGIIALWAAGSRRHWFLRAVVLVAIILVLLLVPARELVIAVTVEILVVVAAVSRWRYRQYVRRQKDASDNQPAHPWHRMSLQDAMLAMVIAAVAATVCREMPRLAPRDVGTFAAYGFLAGSAVAASAWLVVARVKWLVRLVAVLVVLVLTMASATAIDVGNHAWLAWDRDPYRFSKSWAEVVGSIGGVDSLAAFWAIATPIAMGVVCGWCALLVRSGWFKRSETSDVSVSPDARGCATKNGIRRRFYQPAFASFTVALLLVPAVLIYQLARPIRNPAGPITGTNSYDTLLEVAESIDPSQVWGMGGASQDQMILLIAESDERIQRIRDGLRQPFFWPFARPMEGSHPAREFWKLQAILMWRCKNAEQQIDGHPPLLSAAYADHFLFTQIVLSSASRFYSTNAIDDERYALKRLWQVRDSMSQNQLQETLNVLCQADVRPERWQIAKRLRSYDLNQKWPRRLNALVVHWSGESSYRRDEERARFHRTALRLVLVDLAIAFFQSEHGRLPQQLADLTPAILPAVPPDPFSNRPFLYAPAADGYKLYSVGFDGDDDHADVLARWQRSENGDLTLPAFAANRSVPRSFRAGLR